MSRTMPTSVLTSTCRRSCRRLRTRVSGSRCTPTHCPLRKIFVACGITAGEISVRFSMVHSSRNSRMGALALPTEMYAMSARFFTSPTACPSGVSAGQIIPQCELWSWRGFASLPSRPMGEFRRRRCDRVDAYARRFSTCDTPARSPCVPCSPQLPVASEYLSPCVIVLDLIAYTRLTSFPPSRHFCRYPRASLVTLRKSTRNRPPRSGPPRSSLLFP
mmetsp:Transcript_70068/g.222090  ORF Transcript_70068/g.222090 Transcript_70068/m.222090 type:complete len:218 (-) Transcript_70068:405-1058(-)